MAYNLIRKLIDGNSDMVEYCKNAEIIWESMEDKLKEKWGDPNITDILAKEISNEIGNFKNNCGLDHHYKEIMVMVGIGRYYYPHFGFGDDRINKAKIVRNAFQISICDLETKGIAERIAKLYNL